VIDREVVKLNNWRSLGAIVLQVDLSLKDRWEAINNSVATSSWEAVALQEVDNYEWWHSIKRRI
jgi:hypothetical protein